MRTHNARTLPGPPLRGGRKNEIAMLGPVEQAPISQKIIEAPSRPRRGECYPMPGAGRVDFNHLRAAGHRSQVVGLSFQIGCQQAGETSPVCMDDLYLELGDQAAQFFRQLRQLLDTGQDRLFPIVRCRASFPP